MKIGFFDPYLDTMGGGEKYFLDAAAHLDKNGHDISFFWLPSDKNTISQKAKERFNIDITPFSFIPDIFSHKTSFFTKRAVTKSFDAIFYLSDGSIPFLFSKNNILMFQHPVDWVDGKKVTTQLKLKKMQTIMCNSDFVKQHIDKTFRRKSVVITPPVMSVKKEGIQREKIILSVGRFSSGMNAKKHDILIQAFKELQKSVKDWRLVLIGGVRDEDLGFIDTLKNEAKDLPITILPNASYTELIEYYNRSKIYWHATGYGENAEKHPERTEHFGISVVEAMSAGCVPIVFNASGPAQIVADEKYGFLWRTIDELIEKTKKIISNKNIQSLQGNAEKRAEDFNEEKFYKKIDGLLSI